MNRREFLTGIATTGLVCGLDKPLPGATKDLGQYIGKVGRTILKTSFEHGQPVFSAKQHRLVEGVARTGMCSMMGEVTGPNQACFLDIPFESTKDRILHVSFWVRSDKRSACAVFVRIGKVRTSIRRRIDNVPVHTWKHVEARFKVSKNTRGVIQIVAPSSHNAPAGKAWIDDVHVWETVSECDWPEHVEDFPTITYDKSGRLWMAVLERPMDRGLIRVYCLDGQRRQEVCVLEPPGSTGIGAPAIAGLQNGCIVAFAVERRDMWRIAYCFTNGQEARKIVDCSYINSNGSANISPAVAVGERACILWESNAGNARGYIRAS